MRSHLRPAGARGWRACLTVVSALAVLWPCRAALGWGHEGHAVVALIAEHYMTEPALPRCAPTACAHLAEERGALLLDTLSSVEVQSGRPGLPIPPAGLTGLRLDPLVEAPLRLVFVPR